MQRPAPRDLRAIVLGGVVLTTLVAALAFTVAQASGDPGLDAATVTSPATESPSPTPGPSSPTPAPTASTLPGDAVTDAAPVAPQAGAPAAPAPPPAPPPVMDPGVIGMSPGPPTGCGEFPAGQTIYRSFSWTARDGNSVEISYAFTDTDTQATGGFTSLGSGLASQGTVQIARTCPNGAGALPYVTVRVVASNAAGAATAYYWGL